MAFDLILGTTKKNWARGPVSPQLVLPPAEPTIECTDREKAGLEKLASIKMEPRAETAKPRSDGTPPPASSGRPRPRPSLAIRKPSTRSPS